MEYEMIGDSLDIVLSGIAILRYHCGNSKINIIDRKGHCVGDYHQKGIYIEFDPNIKIFSNVDGNDIVEKFNYLINRERWMIKASNPILREKQ